VLVPKDDCIPKEHLRNRAIGVSEGTPIFKLVLAGEGGVGKTSIVNHYLSGAHNEPPMTVGSEFAYQEIRLGKQKIGLSLWDFGGEIQFREFIPVFCLGAHGAIVVFDLSRYSTFRCLTAWLDLIIPKEKHIPIILVGSKSDLDSGGPSEEEVQELCERYQISEYITVSSLTGENITRLFKRISELLIEAVKDGEIAPAKSVKVLCQGTGDKPCCDAE
jgi:small GTP-binding protein